MQRFAGTDDLTEQLERINLAADFLTYALQGWLASRLAGRAGAGKLGHFMDVHFRRDVKNLTIYLWSVKRAGHRRGQPPGDPLRGGDLVEHDYAHFQRFFGFVRGLAAPEASVGERVRAACGGPAGPGRQDGRRQRLVGLGDAHLVGQEPPDRQQPARTRSPTLASGAASPRTNPKNRSKCT